MDERELSAQVEQARWVDRDALQWLIVHYHEPLRVKVAAEIDSASARRLGAADVLQQAYVCAFKAPSNRHCVPDDPERCWRNRKAHEAIADDHGQSHVHPGLQV